MDCREPCCGKLGACAAVIASRSSARANDSRAACFAAFFCAFRRALISVTWARPDKAAGIRRFPPRIMRHTAASWLVLDGVPLYDVQALLGHEDYATTQRYAHLAPGAHGKVIDSWARRLDARVTHG